MMPRSSVIMESTQTGEQVYEFQSHRIFALSGYYFLLMLKAKINLKKGNLWFEP